MVVVVIVIHQASRAAVGRLWGAASKGPGGPQTVPEASGRAHERDTCGLSVWPAVVCVWCLVLVWWNDKGMFERWLGRGVDAGEAEVQVLPQLKGQRRPAQV